MSAGQEKAPTQQRQGFGVNHYEAIHMSKDTTTQHTRNTTSAGTQQLVRVFDGQIGGLPSQVCDGRELHAFLKSGWQFSDWIKKRIEQYGFEENQDFISFSVNPEKPKGGRPTTEYHLSLDMGKELSMVENNEQGRRARRYFIDCEKRAHGQPVLVTDEQHRRLAFETRPIGLLCRDGRYWFCAANIVNALGIRGYSDRITRGLPDKDKCIKLRGKQKVVYISPEAALRAADAAEPQRAERYRVWLRGVLAELRLLPASAMDVSDRDLACLYALCEASERVIRAHNELAPVHKAMRSNALIGVPAALEAMAVGTQYLQNKFGTRMQASARLSGFEEGASANLLGVQLSEALGQPPLRVAPRPVAEHPPLHGDLLDEQELTAVERFGLEALLNTRMLLGFSADGSMEVKTVKPGALVVTPDRLATVISDGFTVKQQHLPEILSAVAGRMRA
ncbi:MAG: hypothetical protein FHK79_18085 [Pseudomonas sp.]|nr:MAG: hypothetical protein FHK79_18085 [Pseudomonas sp.]